MCFEHPYSGIFEDINNRKVACIGVACFEILSRSIFAAIAAIEFAPEVKERLYPELSLILPLVLVYGFSSILHCLIFRGPQMLIPQLIIMTIAHLALIFSLVSMLTWSKSDEWDPRGLITFLFATVAVIKFFATLMMCCGLVDLTTDWGYLVEFFFGILCLVAGIICAFLFTETLMPVTAVVGSSCGTIFSMLSLLDLHQNMSINAWWWEEQIIRGCIYQVIRQYSLMCCRRSEEAPDVLVLVDNSGDTRTRNYVSANRLDRVQPTMRS